MQPFCSAHWPVCCLPLEVGWCDAWRYVGADFLSAVRSIPPVVGIPCHVISAAPPTLLPPPSCLTGTLSPLCDNHPTDLSAAHGNVSCQLSPPVSGHQANSPSARSPTCNHSLQSWTEENLLWFLKTNIPLIHKQASLHILGNYCQFCHIERKRNSVWPLKESQLNCLDHNFFFNF